MGAKVKKEAVRYCLTCAAWHREGGCVTVRLREDPEPEEPEADRFPDRAPEGPFRKAGWY